MTNNKKHFWIAAVQMVFTVGKDDKAQHFERGFNTLLGTTVKQITRKNLAEIQETARQRFLKETFPEEIPVDLLIRDAFIMNISYLGNMSDAEFHAGFENEQAQIKQ